jgi:hypothetical protein
MQLRTLQRWITGEEEQGLRDWRYWDDGGNLLRRKIWHTGCKPRNSITMDLPRSFPEFYAPPFPFRHDFPRSFASKGVTVSSKADEGGNWRGSDSHYAGHAGAGGHRLKCFGWLHVRLLLR